MPKRKPQSTPAANVNPADMAGMFSLFQQFLAAQTAGGAVVPESAPETPPLKGQTPSPVAPPEGERYALDADVEKYPATKVNTKGQVVALPCKPADRKLFMALAKRFGWGMTLTTATDGGKIVTHEATASIAAKAYQSGDHGLFLQSIKIPVTFPTGEEFILSGQCCLMLAKRVH